MYVYKYRLHIYLYEVKKMMQKLYFLPLLLILTIGSVLGACVYTTVSDGSDYFGVNIIGTNTTTMTDDQLFSSYTAFTPRLNFTRVVNGTYTGGETGSSSILLWKTPVNISSSFQLYDADTPTSPIDPSNYTFTQTGDVLNVTLKEGTWNNSLVFYKFNRTFIKNVEDLVTNASGIYTGATTASFLTQAGGSSYGEDKTFQLNGASLGKYVDNSNWAVTWDYTQRVCTGTDSATVSGISKTKQLAYGGFALLAVMIIVTVAWGLISLFKGGNVDFMAIAVAAIGGGIIIMIAYMIIYYVALGLGA
jgi:hypothetical protein